MHTVLLPIGTLNDGVTRLLERGQGFRNGSHTITAGRLHGLLRASEAPHSEGLPCAMEALQSLNEDLECFRDFLWAFDTGSLRDGVAPGRTLKVLEQLKASVVPGTA